MQDADSPSELPHFHTLAIERLTVETIVTSLAQFFRLIEDFAEVCC